MTALATNMSSSLLPRTTFSYGRLRTIASTSRRILHATASNGSGPVTARERQPPCQSSLLESVRRRRSGEKAASVHLATSVQATADTSSSRNPFSAFLQTRLFSCTTKRENATSKARPPKSRDRGPKSEEDTQTDFGQMNMLGNMPVPTTAVDACLEDGFALDSGLKISGSGVLLVSGEAFKWSPWLRKGERDGTLEGADSNNTRSDSSSNTNIGIGGDSTVGSLRNSKGQWEVDNSAWGILDIVWPKPDLLVIGTGAKMLPLSSQTKKDINELGVRIEVQDTRNAAAQFNMLATERGTQQVAAALVPIGWREGK